MFHDRGVWGVSLAKTSQFIGITVLAGCAHLPSQPRGQTAFWGFTGPWDRRSDSSVMEHASNLAQIITGWIALDTTSFRPVLLYPDSIGSLPSVDRKSTRLNSSHTVISYAVFCLKKKKQKHRSSTTSHTLT